MAVDLPVRYCDRRRFGRVMMVVVILRRSGQGKQAKASAAVQGAFKGGFHGFSFQMNDKEVYGSDHFIWRAQGLIGGVRHRAIIPVGAQVGDIAIGAGNHGGGGGDHGH